MNQRNLSLSSLPAEARQNLFINRELSWLKFNERVLGEAARDDVPLCERLSFLSIFQTDLDEFFKVRIGALVDRLQLGGEPDEKNRSVRRRATCRRPLGSPASLRVPRRGVEPSP